MTTRARSLCAVLAMSLGAGLGAIAAAPSAAAATGFAQLRGHLHLIKGTCRGGRPAGSYLAVTFGTRAIRNTASSCDKGSVTLLSPGQGSLSTHVFSPVTDDQFDGRGNATADTVTRPVRFGRYELSLVTSPRNLQDAARGPAFFTAPHIYVSGTQAFADMRAVQALYDGAADSSCASANGDGCWLIGAERATGSFDPSTHRLTLTWFSGQSFVPSSAGTAVHLVATFTGSVTPVPEGATVDLGTASVAAGSPNSAAVTEDVADHGRARRADASGRDRARRRGRREAALVGEPAGGSGVTRLAEIVVLVNGIALAGAARVRRRSRA